MRRGLGALLLAGLVACTGPGAGTTDLSLEVRPASASGQEFETPRGAQLLLGPSLRLPVRSSELEEAQGSWLLVVELEPDAGKRLTELCGTILGQPLAIMAGNEVWTAPRVAEPIGARLAIPLPDARSLAEAEVARQLLLGG